MQTSGGAGDTKASPGAAGLLSSSSLSPGVGGGHGTPAAGAWAGSALDSTRSKGAFVTAAPVQEVTLVEELRSGGRAGSRAGGVVAGAPASAVAGTFATGDELLLDELADELPPPAHLRHPDLLPAENSKEDSDVDNGSGLLSLPVFPRASRFSRAGFCPGSGGKPLFSTVLAATLLVSILGIFLSYLYFLLLELESWDSKGCEGVTADTSMAGGGGLLGGAGENASSSSSSSSSTGMADGGITILDDENSSSSSSGAGDPLLEHFMARPYMAKVYINCVCCVQLVALCGSVLFCVCVHRRHVLVTLLGLAIDAAVLSVLGWGIYLYLSESVCSFRFLTASIWYCVTNQILLVVMFNAWSRRARDRERAKIAQHRAAIEAEAAAEAAGSAAAAGGGCSAAEMPDSSPSSAHVYRCTAAPLVTEDAIEPLEAGATTSSGSPLAAASARMTNAADGGTIGANVSPRAAAAAAAAGGGGGGGGEQRAFFSRGTVKGEGTVPIRASAAKTSVAAARAALPGKGARGGGSGSSGGDGESVLAVRSIRGTSDSSVSGHSACMELLPARTSVFDEQPAQKQQQPPQPPAGEPLFVVQRRPPAAVTPQQQQHHPPVSSSVPGVEASSSAAPAAVSAPPYMLASPSAGALDSSPLSSDALEHLQDLELDVELAA